MSQPVNLRLARRDETAAMTDLCIRSKRSNGYDDDFMAQCLTALVVSPSDLDASEFWVAETDGALGGLASWHAGQENGVAELMQLYVAPEFKRMGIGRRLAGKVFDRMRANGARRVFLDSDPFAVPFYEALGFRVTGQSPSGVVAGRMLPRMSMTFRGLD